VLDGDGRAVGAWKPAIAPQRLRDGLHAMLLTRLFEERMFRSHRQGKTSFFMKSTGEEAIGRAQSMCSRPAHVLSHLSGAVLADGAGLSAGQPGQPDILQ